MNCFNNIKAIPARLVWIFWTWDIVFYFLNDNLLWFFLVFKLQDFELIQDKVCSIDYLQRIPVHFSYFLPFYLSFLLISAFSFKDSVTWFTSLFTLISLLKWTAASQTLMLMSLAVQKMVLFISGIWWMHLLYQASKLIPQW